VTQTAGQVQISRFGIRQALTPSDEPSTGAIDELRICEADQVPLPSGRSQLTPLFA
jgi:hypothetical protein